MDDASQAPVDTARRWRILGYSGVLAVAINFATPVTGIHVIPLSFILKNRLHLTASEVALFSLLGGVPAYFSFAFGMARDFWSPFGLGDRGYLILFGALSAALFAAFSFVGLSVPAIFAVSVLTTISFLFLWSAWNGFASTIGQQYEMSGQMSALWNFVGTAAITASLFLGGVLSGVLEKLGPEAALRGALLAAASVAGLIALLGTWRPRAVFDGLRQGGQENNFFADLKRLVQHRPIYPALLIWMLWNFAPGTQTALQYYLSDTLHASDAVWGSYNAIFYAATLPAFLVFGFLSPRFSLQTLLWLGALLGVTQYLSLLFVHSAQGVLLAAIPIGLSGGIATASYFDLLMRSCPKGLEGTLMMAAWSLYSVIVNVGNLWGTNLYEHHGGFVTCVLVTTAVYAMIPLIIPFIPKGLIRSADGEESVA